jgi:hypothetical protein
MKYLILALLFIFGGTTLAAQDTLYIKGKRKPLIVDITIVKKKSLNYTKIDGGLVRTVKMKNVKKIKFYKQVEIASTQQRTTDNNPSKRVNNPNFDEFLSTFSLNSIGTTRFYGGLNYLHHIPKFEAKNGKHHFFAKVGGGHYRRVRSNLFANSLRAEGFYLEFGILMEVSSTRNPKNRFHIGLDFNNRWAEQISFNFIGSNSEVEVKNITEYAIQIPIGYTFRSREGFYLTTGLEITTEKLFPAAHIGVGVAFGR